MTLATFFKKFTTYAKALHPHHDVQEDQPESVQPPVKNTSPWAERPPLCPGPGTPGMPPRPVTPKVSPPTRHGYMQQLEAHQLHQSPSPQLQPQLYQPPSPGSIMYQPPSPTMYPQVPPPQPLPQPYPSLYPSPQQMAHMQTQAYPYHPPAPAQPQIPAQIQPIIVQVPAAADLYRDYSPSYPPYPRGSGRPPRSRRPPSPFEDFYY